MITLTCNSVSVDVREPQYDTNTVALNEYTTGKDIDGDTISFLRDIAYSIDTVTFRFIRVKYDTALKSFIAETHKDSITLGGICTGVLVEPIKLTNKYKKKSCLYTDFDLKLQVEQWLN